MILASSINFGFTATNSSQCHAQLAYSDDLFKYAIKECIATGAILYSVMNCMDLDMCVR